MRCDPVDELLLLRSEHGSSLTVEAHESPHGAASAKHRAKLIGQTKRFEDVAIASAAFQPAIRCRGQRAHPGSVVRELGPLVHVIRQKLVVDEVRA